MSLNILFIMKHIVFSINHGVNGINSNAIIIVLNIQRHNALSNLGLFGVIFILVKRYNM